MRAVVVTRCCRADELYVSERPVPRVRPGWVLVRVHAAGLNHSEALLRLYEADSEYIQTPIVPGIECVGEIEDPSDSGFRQGQRVMALMGGMGRSFNGSYAEYALLPTKNVFAVESDLDWLSLAAVPETYFTAYGSLFQCLMLRPEDTLLVRGATSTVGQASIQLAKAVGATVIAACRRESSFEKLRVIGADTCLIDDGALSRQALDVKPNKVLELIGPKTLMDSMQTVATPGFVCNTGLLGGVFTLPRFDPIKDIPNGVFLSGFYSNYPARETITRMMCFIKEKHIRPLYSQAFTLDQIAEAHALLERGGAGGKIILRIC